LAAGGQTNEHSEELTFGRLLKTLRAEKGLELKTVSAETKIAVSTLRLLEEEAYDKLPDNVFVKGFLRAYAGVLGTSPEALVQNFLAGRHHFNETLRYEASRTESNRSPWQWLILAAGLLVCILYASISAIKTPSTGTAPETDVSRVEKNVQAGIDTLSETDVQRPTETPEPQTGYLLEINAVEETWLKVIVDRLDTREYLLNPGDSLELTATSGFNLLIGNATGINLKLNHQPVTLDGKDGQVITRKLP
jgi:transcriptional regulator with XRE-family HTH domain